MFGLHHHSPVRAHGLVLETVRLVVPRDHAEPSERLLATLGRIFQDALEDIDAVHTTGNDLARGFTLHVPHDSQRAALLKLETALSSYATSAGMTLNLHEAARQADDEHFVAHLYRAIVQLLEH